MTMKKGVDLRLKRGSTADVGSYAGPSAELVVDTDVMRPVLQDGETPGGIPLARLDELGTSSSIEDGESITLTDDDGLFIDQSNNHDPTISDSEASRLFKVKSPNDNEITLKLTATDAGLCELEVVVSDGDLVSSKMNIGIPDTGLPYFRVDRAPSVGNDIVNKTALESAIAAGEVRPLLRRSATPITSDTLSINSDMFYHGERVNDNDGLLLNIPSYSSLTKGAVLVIHCACSSGGLGGDDNLRLIQINPDGSELIMGLSGAFTSERVAYYGVSKFQTFSLEYSGDPLIGWLLKHSRSNHN